ncbi:MAG: S-formylglutathione hydrolase [Steroidobacteraceae bacterium]
MATLASPLRTDTISQHRCFGGTVSFYRHVSRVTDSLMRFSVFVPPQAGHGPVPVLYYLAGLTCTEETFMIKAGALQHAARLGLMLVAPDTSPRSAPLPGDKDSWDFGIGAGFYVDATVAPWAQHYRMYTYVTEELPALINADFPADSTRQGIFGHSMGGHGALVIGLRNPDRYRSISAFAPIAAPSQVPWGRKAFSGYLGVDESLWGAYDAANLMRGVTDAKHRPKILIDQGSSDQFLEPQLKPQLLEEAARQVGYPLKLRYQPGFDHGYYFISTFIRDHLQHHARTLLAGA